MPMVRFTQYHQGLKWAGSHRVADPALFDLLGLWFTATVLVITAILQVNKGWFMNEAKSE